MLALEWREIPDPSAESNREIAGGVERRGIAKWRDRFLCARDDRILFLLRVRQPSVRDERRRESEGRKEQVVERQRRKVTGLAVLASSLYVRRQPSEVPSPRKS